MEPLDHASTLGNHYILNIIDDFLSYCWSIPLSAKSEAFPALQAWELARKAETGLHVGILHSDNGELKHLNLKAWLLSCGTQHQFTTPHTSAQNSCVEHVHRTLMDKARAMRSFCACYLTN